MPTRYVFAAETTDDADAHVHRSVMMQALAQMFDPFSTKRLDSVGIGPDARCLVVAVGASKIAARLADDFAPEGEVIATDTDHEHTHHHPRVRLLTHNIVTEPLPPGGFDVIQVRLLLGHLPQRDDVLAKLAGALNPEGSLLVEEFAGTWDISVLSAPDWHEANRLFGAYHDAFRAMLTAAGNDLTWSRRVHDAMHGLGLDVDTTGDTGTWTGDSPGTQLPWATAGLRRDKLIENGMSAADIDAFRALLANPDLRVLGNLALSTHGRRVQ